MGEVLNLFPRSKAGARGNLRLTRVRSVAACFLSYGRQAWNDTWITRYSPEHLFPFLSDVRSVVNRRASQGTVFYLERLPCFELTFDHRRFVWTEINSTKPFSRSSLQQWGNGRLLSGIALSDWLIQMSEHSALWRSSQNFEEGVIVQEVRADFVDWYSFLQAANYRGFPFLKEGYHKRVFFRDVGERRWDWDVEEKRALRLTSFNRVLAELAGAGLCST